MTFSSGRSRGRRRDWQSQAEMWTGSDSGRKSSFRSGKDRIDLNISGMTVQGRNLEKLIVIEGAYSCHPYFGDIYDIRVFMDVDPAEQQKRILTRNGPEMLPRFISEWIPKEELYFKTFRIKEKCSICLTEIPHFPFM